jgi:hypothetical protein
MDKICSRCDQKKHLSLFYKKKHQKSGFSSECKECYLKWMHSNKNNTPNFEGSKICIECDLVKPNTEFHRQNQSQDGLKNTCKTCVNKTRRYSRYCITEDQYNTLLQKQNNKCAICEKSKRLDIDHCHQTNKVRGILCNDCNTSLGKFGDNINGVQKVINYLIASESLEL